jgi:hypothetical protein
MKGLKYFIGALFFAIFTFPVYAQDAKIEKEFEQVREAYNKLEYLSYNIQYLYAREKVPGDYIDSLKGSYKVNGKRYWGMLDSVEYIQNDSFFISIYPEEKVMLLNSVAPSWVQANTDWDSIWKLQKEKLKLSIVEEGGRMKIEMRYLNDSVYKNIELWYNSKSHLMEKMICVMRQPQDFPGEANDNVNNDNEFVIIELRFSNYKTSAFDKSILDIGRYIKKKEKEFQPSEKYPDYTVLVGSPNLIN